MLLLLLAMFNQPCQEADDAILRLDNSVYVERLLAEKKIISLGYKALPALEYASRHATPEVKIRSRQLLEVYYDAPYEGMKAIPMIANTHENTTDYNYIYGPLAGPEVSFWLKEAEGNYQLATKMKTDYMLRTGVPVHVVREWLLRLVEIEENYKKGIVCVPH